MARHHKHKGLISRAVRAVEHFHNPKRAARGTAKQLVYVNRVGGAIVSTAGGFFGGAIVGEALAAGFAEEGYHLRGVQARNEGYKGKDARHYARSERKRDFIINSVGAGVGAGASGVTTAANGGTVAQSVAAVGVGQGGTAILGIGGGVFGGTSGATAAGAGSTGAIVTEANLAAQTSEGVGGGFVGSYAQLGLGATAAGGGVSVSTVAAIGGGALALVQGVLKALSPTSSKDGGVPGENLPPGASGGSAGADSGGEDAFSKSGILGGLAQLVKDHPILALAAGLAVGWAVWKGTSE